MSGFDCLLAEARAALSAAQKQDAEAALTTEAMAKTEKGLARNAKALEKSRAAFLKALETGAEALAEEVRPLYEVWADLLAERAGLYGNLVNMTGQGDVDRKMLGDPLTRLFGDDYDVASVLDLAEVLLPLVEVYQGWPRVKGRPRQRLW